jgi:hypothetical protein
MDASSSCRLSPRPGVCQVVRLCAAGSSQHLASGDNTVSLLHSEYGSEGRASWLGPSYQLCPPQPERHQQVRGSFIDLRQIHTTVIQLEDRSCFFLVLSALWAWQFQQFLMERGLKYSPHQSGQVEDLPLWGADEPGQVPGVVATGGQCSPWTSHWTPPSPGIYRTRSPRPRSVGRVFISQWDW